MSDLTKKQQAVANLLMEGMSNKEIARDLDISYKTVRNTVQAILEKLGVHNRTAAAVKLYKMLHPRSWQPIETVPKDGTEYCADSPVSCYRCNGAGFYGGVDNDHIRCDPCPAPDTREYTEDGHLIVEEGCLLRNQAAAVEKEYEHIHPEKKALIEAQDRLNFGWSMEELEHIRTCKCFMPTKLQPRFARNVEAIAAALLNKDKRLVDLENILHKIIEISDRKHDVWDEAKALLKGGEA